MAWLVISAQVVSLLCFILFHAVTLLLHLPFTLLRTWGLLPSQVDSTQDQEAAVFYEGLVTHVRKLPKENRFRYPVRMSVIDLENPPSWFVHSSQAQDHMTAQQARLFAGTDGPVKLLTDPETVGYIQNPISVYYCYDGSTAALKVCIAEVTNTPWGERVTFLFRPTGEAVTKALHVSPFQDMHSTWHLQASDPKDTLKLVVRCEHPELGKFFYADLVAVKSTQPGIRTELAGWSTVLKYGYQPHRVAVLIYWQAVKLIWKGVPLYNPPNPADYQAKLSKQGNPHTHPRSASTGCFFTWRAAKSWPWNGYY